MGFRLIAFSATVCLGLADLVVINTVLAPQLSEHSDRNEANPESRSRPGNPTASSSVSPSTPSAAVEKQNPSASIQPKSRTNSRPPKTGSTLTNPQRQKRLESPEDIGRPRTVQANEKPVARKNHELARDKSTTHDPVIIQFRTASTAIHPSLRSKLKKCASVLRANPQFSVSIVGHTDRRGRRSSNLQLSVNRARNVALYLGDLGVAADRISILGKGEASPRDPANNRAAWRKNRRVEITFH